MKSPVRSGAVVLLVLVGAASAKGPGVPCSIEQLEHMSWSELEHLYRCSNAGKVPCGYLPGKAIYCRCARGSRVRSCVTGMVWHGKHFEGDCLLNQWSGFRAVDARIYVGPSWLDAKPSIIMDYRGRKGMWSDVRDEIREVAPGLYLGIMYRDRCTGPDLKMFFALQGCVH